MSKKYALVLAGGGAKGAYQIGAWKAFKELGIKFEAIIGVSVGALNGILLLQNKYKEAIELWNKIKLEDIVNIPINMPKNNIEIFSIDFFKNLKKLLLEISRHKGLDSSPLYNIIKKYTDERNIRKSKIDFGLVSYRITDFSPVVLFLEDIPEGQLADYLLASASLPGFKPAKIGAHEFLDGGIYNNIPHKIIKSRGYRKIIVIDISGPGIKGEIKVEGTETVYIKNSIDFGSVLDFRPNVISNFIELGYLDTLKIFGKLDGIYYFYKNDEKLKILLEKIFSSSIKNPKETIKNYLPEEIRYNKYLSIAFIEQSARYLGIEIIKLYSLNEFIKNVFDKIDENLKLNPKFLENKPKNFIEKIISNDEQKISTLKITYEFLKEFYKKNFNWFEKMINGL